MQTLIDSEKTWYITGTGIHPDCFFEHYGIEVDFSEAEGDLAGLASLESLWRHLRPPAAGRIRQDEHDTRPYRCLG